MACGPGRRYEYITIGTGTSAVDLTSSFCSYEDAQQFSNVGRIQLSASGYPVDMLNGINRPVGVKSVVLSGYITQGSYAVMEDAIDAYFALHNSVQTVTRQRRDGRDNQTAECLIEVVAGRAQRARTLSYPVDITITPTGRAQFYGTSRSVYSGTITSAGTFEIPAIGNDSYYDAVITLEAESGINAFQLTMGDADIKITNQMTPGQEAIIDCGALTAIKAAQNLVDDLTRESGHSIVEWMPIPPGRNEMTVTVTTGIGSSVNVTVAYKDAYRL